MAKSKEEKPVATSYILSDEAKAVLKIMAESEGRSMSKELDKIILSEAKRRKITIPG